MALESLHTEHRAKNVVRYDCLGTKLANATYGIQPSNIVAWVAMTEHREQDEITQQNTCITHARLQSPIISLQTVQAEQ